MFEQANLDNTLIFLSVFFLFEFICKGALRNTSHDSPQTTGPTNRGSTVCGSVKNGWTYNFTLEICHVTRPPQKILHWFNFETSERKYVGGRLA